MSEAEQEKVFAAIGAQAAQAAMPVAAPKAAPTNRDERRRYAALSRRSQTR